MVYGSATVYVLGLHIMIPPWLSLGYLYQTDEDKACAGTAIPEAAGATCRKRQKKIAVYRLERCIISSELE
jgi:hypothetical protein